MKSDIKARSRSRAGRSGGEASMLPRKGTRLSARFIGTDDGQWELASDWSSKSLSDGRRRTWEAVFGLERGAVFSVEGATEHNEGFLRALREMVAAYPEIEGMSVRFDGPPVPVFDLLHAKKVGLDEIAYLHGTSRSAADVILRQGLRPRTETGVEAAYGAGISHAPKADPNLTYLTTQLNAAEGAARDASRGGKGPGVILEIDGSKLRRNRFEPDVDSRAETAEESLARLGAVGYRGSIPASAIRVAWVYDGATNNFVRV